MSAKSQVIASKENRRLSFEFAGWLEFETKAQAEKASKDIRTLYADRCHIQSKNEPKVVHIRTDSKETVKALAKSFDASCGWRTTGEERAEKFKLDLASGSNVGHAGKLTTRNYRFFFVRATIGKTFDYSESFAWEDVVKDAGIAGWEVEYLKDRTGRISGRK